jgi:dipeptidyl aminopeptidase/acylaminoacyl peptidase
MILKFQEEGKAPDIVAQPVDGSQPRVLPNPWPNLIKRGFGDLNSMRVVAWLPSDELVFTARFGDATNVWRIPIDQMDKAPPVALTLAPWVNDQAGLRGNRLVFSNARNTNQVWSLPADLNQGRVLGEAVRVTPELVEAQFPDISPDGSMLAYISRKMGGQGAFLLDLKTGRDRTLSMAEENAAYTTFSPDGTKVAFSRSTRERPGYVIPVSGGEAKMLGGIDGRIRGWSKDERYWLIWRFANNGFDRTGTFDVKTGESKIILSASEFGVGAPRLSPDNRWIAFQSTQSQVRMRRIWIAPFRGSQPVPQSEWTVVSESGVNPFWSPDSRSVYFYSVPEDTEAWDFRGAPGVRRLMRQPLEEGRPKGPAVEFYRFSASQIFAGIVLNTISATKDRVYLLLNGGNADIWMMTLPE